MVNNLFRARRLLVAFGILAATGAFQSTLLAQAQQRKAYVSALDASGAPLPSLSPDEVVVREDGVRREVLSVVPATEPMQIALLVDNASAASPAISDMRTSLTRFVEQMTPANEVALITYGDRPTIVTEYTSNTELLRKGVSRVFATPGAGAYMLDAISESAKGLLKRDAPRPVMLVVGVEGTEFSSPNFEGVLQTLRDSGASLHVLFISPAGTGETTDEIRNRNIVIDRGTADTGGRRDNLLSSMALADTLKKVAAELSGQYLVTYARPQTLIPPEKVQISAAKPGVTVRGTPVRSAK